MFLFDFFDQFIFFKKVLVWFVSEAPFRVYMIANLENLMLVVPFNLDFFINFSYKKAFAFIKIQSDVLLGFACGDGHWGVVSVDK